MGRGTGGRCTSVLSALAVGVAIHGCRCHDVCPDPYDPTFAEAALEPVLEFQDTECMAAHRICER